MSKGFFNLLHTKIGIYHGPAKDMEISPRVLVKWYVASRLLRAAPVMYTKVNDRGTVGNQCLSLATRCDVCYTRLHICDTA